MTTIEFEEDTLENVLSVTDRSAARSTAQPKGIRDFRFGQLIIGLIVGAQLAWLIFLGLAFYHLLS